MAYLIVADLMVQTSWVDNLSPMSSYAFNRRMSRLSVLDLIHNIQSIRPHMFSILEKKNSVRCFFSLSSILWLSILTVGSVHLISPIYFDQSVMVLIMRTVPNSETIVRD